MEEIGNPALTPFPVMDDGQESKCREGQGWPRAADGQESKCREGRGWPGVTELLRSVPHLWRGNRLPVVAGPTCPTGFPELDRELLGGGWPTGAVVEFLSDTGGIGELRLLLPALQRLTQAGNHVLLIQPPHVPNAVVLQRAGIQLSRVLVARPEHEQDALWVAEQALRNPGCGAVLAWPRIKGSENLKSRITGHSPRYHHDHDFKFSDPLIRRLQVAAEAGQSTLFLYRNGHRHVSQWAALRLELLPMLAVSAEENGQGLRISVLKAVGTHRRPQVQVRV